MAVNRIENIRIGHNPIVYYGPAFDLDGVGSPINSSNTLAVHRLGSSPGKWVPGGGSNDFHLLENGFNGHGGCYVIVASANFILDQCSPGEVAD